MPGDRPPEFGLEPLSTSHLSAEEIAAYLDGVVPLGDRPRIETHLVRCDACFDEILALVRQLRPD